MTIRRVFPPINFDDYGGFYETVYGRYPRSIVDLVINQALLNDRDPACDLAVVIQESAGTLNPYIEVETDDGDIPGAQAEHSVSALQINVKIRERLPKEQWMGYDGMVRAYERIINPAWNRAFRNLGGWSAWAENPVSFTDAFGPAAQISIEWKDDTIPGHRDNSVAGFRYAQALVLIDVRWKVLLGEAKDAIERLLAQQPEPHVCPPLSPGWLMRVGLIGILADGTETAEDAFADVKTVIDQAGAGRA